MDLNESGSWCSYTLQYVVINLNICAHLGHWVDSCRWSNKKMHIKFTLKSNPQLINHEEEEIIIRKTLKDNFLGNNGKALLAT